MPTGKRSNAGKQNTGPSSADLDELQAALAAQLHRVTITAWPLEEWARLTFAAHSRGYSLVISPQMDGGAVRISVPVGTKRLAVTAANDEQLLEAVRALILSVEKLPKQ